MRQLDIRPLSHRFLSDRHESIFTTSYHWLWDNIGAGTSEAVINGELTSLAKTFTEVLASVSVFNSFGRHLFVSPTATHNLNDDRPQICSSYELPKDAAQMFRRTCISRPLSQQPVLSGMYRGSLSFHVPSKSRYRRFGSQGGESEQQLLAVETEQVRLTGFAKHRK